MSLNFFQDRIHRLGQTRPVQVFRYVAAGSLEQRLLLLQASLFFFSSYGFR